MACGNALDAGAIRLLARPLPGQVRGPKPICGPALCAALVGPVDQRKIAAFARRKPWVQIPPGPLRPSGDPRAAFAAERILGPEHFPARRAGVLDSRTATAAEDIVRPQGCAASRAGVGLRRGFRGALGAYDHRRPLSAHGLPRLGGLPAIGAASFAGLRRLEDANAFPGLRCLVRRRRGLRREGHGWWNFCHRVKPSLSLRRPWQS